MDRGRLLPVLLSISLCIPVTCLSCKAASDTYEAFLDIPLEIEVGSLASDLPPSPVCWLPARQRVRVPSPAMMNLAQLCVSDYLRTHCIAVLMGLLALASFAHANRGCLSGLVADRGSCFLGVFGGCGSLALSCLPPSGSFVSP